MAARPASTDDTVSSGSSRAWNRTYLVLHGVENRRPAEHWQHALARALREGGEQVFYPQLPDPDAPALAAWMEAFEAELAMMQGERIVICHSLACAAWLHLSASVTRPPADRLLLVSPPGPSAFTWDVIAGFTTEPLDLGLLAVSVTRPRLVSSDNDPYCTEGAAIVLGEPLGCDIDVLAGAGHVTPDDGYGPWPSALTWCLDASTSLVANS